MNAHHDEITLASGDINLYVIKDTIDKPKAVVIIVHGLCEHCRRYNYPCLILHGGSDQIVTPEASKSFYESIASTDKTLKIYDGLYHEIMNEPERDTVIRDIIHWIDSHI